MKYFKKTSLLSLLLSICLSSAQFSTNEDFETSKRVINKEALINQTIDLEELLLSNYEINPKLQTGDRKLVLFNI